MADRLSKLNILPDGKIAVPTGTRVDDTVLRVEPGLPTATALGIIHANLTNAARNAKTVPSPKRGLQEESTS